MRFFDNQVCKLVVSRPLLWIELVHSIVEFSSILHCVFIIAILEHSDAMLADIAPGESFSAFR